MIMGATDHLVYRPPPCLDGLPGRLSRNECVAAAAVRVSPAGLEQGLVVQEVVLRLEKRQEGPLEPAVMQLADASSMPVWYRQVGTSGSTA